MVGDGGDFVACAAYTMRPRGGLSWLDPGAFGTLGVGGGFALGTLWCSRVLTHSLTNIHHSSHLQVRLCADRKVTCG